MLLNRPVFDLIELVELPLEDVEFSASCSVQIQSLGVPLQTVSHFQEVRGTEEEVVVLGSSPSLDHVGRHEVALLGVVLLQLVIAILLEPTEV